MKTGILKIFYRHSVTALFTLFASHSLSAQNDFYWVGGSGNWSDYANHWATTSGGSTFYTNAPEDDDNVFFDANSFTEEGQVVTLDDYPNIHDLDWGGVSFSPTIRSLNPGDEGIEFKGSVYLNKEVCYDIGYLQFDSGVPYSEPEVLKTNGASLENSTLNIGQSFVDFSLLDSTSAEAIILDQNPNGIGHIPSFSSNGFAIHALEQLKIGSGTLIGNVDLSNTALYSKSVTITQSGNNFQSEGASVHILYEDGITRINKNSFSAPPFETYRISANHLIRLNDPIFDKLIIDPGVTLSIDPNITGIEFNSITANGEGVYRIIIKSDETGVAASLIKTSGTVEFHNVDFQDIEATGGATYTAYGSKNLGNVTGITFIKADQSITFDPIESRDYEDIGQVLSLNAYTDSGLEILYESSDPTVATINGDELTIVGIGTANITASQAGDEAYNPAEPVIITFEVTKADQQILFSQIDDVNIDIGSIALEASSTSRLPVTFEIIGSAVLEGTTLELLDIGVIQVTAHQEGNDNYHPAKSISQSFDVFQILGVNDQFRIKAYPNPVIQNLTIESDAMVKIYLLDPLGRETYMGESVYAEIDMLGLARGIYVLKLGKGEKWMFYRIIKN